MFKLLKRFVCKSKEYKFTNEQMDILTKIQAKKLLKKYNHNNGTIIYL